MRRCTARENYQENEAGENEDVEARLPLEKNDSPNKQDCSAGERPEHVFELM